MLENIKNNNWEHFLTGSAFVSGFLYPCIVWFEHANFNIMTLLVLFIVIPLGLILGVLFAFVMQIYIKIMLKIGAYLHDRQSLFLINKTTNFFILVLILFVLSVIGLVVYSFLTMPQLYP